MVLSDAVRFWGRILSEGQFVVMLLPNDIADLHIYSRLLVTPYIPINVLRVYLRLKGAGLIRVGERNVRVGGYQAY